VQRHELPVAVRLDRASLRPYFACRKYLTPERRAPAIDVADLQTSDPKATPTGHRERVFINGLFVYNPGNSMPVRRAFISALPSGNPSAENTAGKQRIRSMIVLLLFTANLSNAPKHFLFELLQHSQHDIAGIRWPIRVERAQ
jgi:hypothetical protein